MREREREREMRLNLFLHKDTIYLSGHEETGSGRVSVAGCGDAAESLPLPNSHSPCHTSKQLADY